MLVSPSIVLMCIVAKSKTLLVHGIEGLLIIEHHIRMW